MNANLVIDADQHVCEPSDLWESNLPTRLADRGIRVRWNSDTGFDECSIDGQLVTDRGLVGLGNAAEPFDDFSRGRRYEDLNPAAFDPQERVKVLDAEGIDLAVLYPGLGLTLGGINDPELAVASCRVYNEWVADWCGAAPNRLVAAGALPMQDPKAAAEEVRRLVSMGLRGGFVRPNPYGGKPLHHDDFRPVWAALSETGLPVCFHPADLGDMPGAYQGLAKWMAPGTHDALVLLFDQQMTLSNLVYGGTLEHFPELKVLILESGGGWIAHWMDRLDGFIDTYGWGAAKLSLPPSEYFQRQCWISFDPTERSASPLASLIGHDRFVWASDFPHSDARYPGVLEHLRSASTDLPSSQRSAYLGANAQAVYGIHATMVAPASVSDHRK